MTHTPGPWTASHISDDERIGIITNDNGIIVGCGSHLTEANARLIAAAPDLLAALEWAMDQIEDDLDLDHQEAVKAAYAAIARAKGQS
jgi:hypothetical protein